MSMGSNPTRFLTTRRRRVRRSLMAGVCALSLVAACSSDDSSESGVDDTTVTTPPSSAPASTETTDSSTSTTVTDEATWVTIDSADISGHIALPCCGDDFHGQPSPPLPADGAPLLDGDYYVRMEWPTDPSQPLELQFYRYEACSVLPEDTCGDPEGADNMGIDFTTFASLTIEPDADDVEVLLLGFRGFEAPESAAARGSMAALVELVAAVDTAYADVFAARLEAGEEPDAIVDDVLADPQGGFVLAPEGAGLFVFEYDDAPPLLFQVVFDTSVAPPLALRGSDVLGLNSVVVRDGTVTVLVYAGFYS